MDSIFLFISFPNVSFISEELIVKEDSNFSVKLFINGSLVAKLFPSVSDRKILSSLILK